jgi:hypothetical protein
MSSFLERLLVAVTVMATPLLAVAATPKKSKRPRATRSTSKAEPSSRAKKPKVAPKSKEPPAKPARRGASSRGKPPEPAPGKAPVRRPEPATPQPKPVAPSGRAFLLLPENGKYANAVPRFRWLSVGGATRYEVQWSEHPDFSGAYSTISVATGESVPEDRPLRVGQIYYWRVRGGNDGGWGPWSPAASFQVLEEPPAS